jgi:hypothetical protein
MLATGDGLHEWLRLTGNVLAITQGGMETKDEAKCACFESDAIRSRHVAQGVSRSVTRGGRTPVSRGR